MCGCELVGVEVGGGVGCGEVGEGDEERIGVLMRCCDSCILGV